MTADCLGDTALVRELFPALGDFAAEINLAERIRPGLRLLMLLLLLLLTLASLALAGCWPYWSLSFAGLAVLALLVAAVAFPCSRALPMRTVHGTVFAIQRLKQGRGWLLSWPMAWPCLTKRRLQRLHHRWHGSDRRDPEPAPQRPDA